VTKNGANMPKEIFSWEYDTPYPPIGMSLPGEEKVFQFLMEELLKQSEVY